VREHFNESGIRGVDYLAPVIHKNSQPLSSRLQLKINTILSPGLHTAGLQTVTCRPNNEEPPAPLPLRDPEEWPYCSRVKYHFGHRGMFRFPRKVFDEAPDIVKSHEWFGSGASASRMVLISRRTADIILDAKWRGVTMEPVELVNQ